MYFPKVQKRGSSIQLTIPRDLITKYNLGHGDTVAVFPYEAEIDGISPHSNEHGVRLVLSAKGIFVAPILYGIDEGGNKIIVNPKRKESTHKEPAAAEAGHNEEKL